MAVDKFIIATHYELALKVLKQGHGIDLYDRGPAVAESVFSTSVQYGPHSQ